MGRPTDLAMFCVNGELCGQIAYLSVSFISLVTTLITHARWTNYESYGLSENANAFIYLRHYFTILIWFVPFLS